MPRNSGPVRQTGNAPRKNQSSIIPSVASKRDPIPPMRNVSGNQPPGRFSGSVVWAELISPPHKPSNLGKGTNSKFGVVNETVDDEEPWETQAADSKTTAQATKENQEDLVTAMKELKVRPSSKPESTVPEWRRVQEKPVFRKPSPSRVGSNFPRGDTQTFNSKPAASRVGTMMIQHARNQPGQNDRPFRGAPTEMSCTYHQFHGQPRMKEARPDDYRPFYKHEFVVGTILRGIIHEQDIMGTPDPAMSQAPTKFTSAINRDQASRAPTNSGNRHIKHGDWGPIYSENRFLIVVHNRPGDHYYAVPVYSHKGNGLTKKPHKNEYVSVADGRYPDHVVQQSAHQPITAELKDGVDELLPMSAAYASYAVPRKYGLPVAHQGRLNEESTKRLVSMYHEWTGRNE